MQNWQGTDCQVTTAGLAKLASEDNEDSEAEEDLQHPIEDEKVVDDIYNLNTLSISTTPILCYSLDLFMELHPFMCSLAMVIS